MSRLLVTWCAIAAGNVLAADAKRYEPNWESIDSRPTPGWWSDAKFGIFIRWGVYSVPAFAPKGEYAEWYWERIGKPGNPGECSEFKVCRTLVAWSSRHPLTTAENAGEFLRHTA